MTTKGSLLFICLAVATLGTTRICKAAVYDLGALSGVMLQPASNYYLLVNGAYFTISAPDEWLALEAGYFERPRFSSMGFVDQDYGGYLMLGRTITGKNPAKYGLWAGFGFSRIAGYIRADDVKNAELGLPSRTYSIDGMSTALEAYVRWHGVRLSISHHAFVGLMQAFQVEAHVAWPFNFVLIKLGCYL